ncbi:DUF6644 family protein [Serpens gallinarum]|nr:DUF6644 family protein [Serpens gallinarum]
MGAAQLAAALEGTALGVMMRESDWLYPVVNLLHLLGLVLLLGAMLFLDLRLLGLAPRVPLGLLAPWLTGFAVSGLLIQLASGLALFAADAMALIGNRLLQIKLLLVLFGIGNAGLFRWRFSRVLPKWEIVPLPARMQAGLSLCAWLSVMAAGRLLAYF